MLTQEWIREKVVELVSRPGHEKVRSLVYELLVEGIGARSTELLFERRLPEVHGRIDALLGHSVFEFKTDLRREQNEAERQLNEYLRDREAQSGQRFVGIATDGATFMPYELRRGSLRALPSYTPSLANPRGLLAWLSSAVSLSSELEPTPDVVQRELGSSSLAWHLAREELAGLWSEVNQHPDVRLKRDLWARLLERVYGASVESDDLFFQHTYLTIIAKTMAVHVLGISMPAPADLLSGRPFEQSDITGVVESDFFDWPLGGVGGSQLVRRIALQTARFRLRDVKVDVLKGLYESLIDPQQRHDLGEYYTPDWLAARICAEAITAPLDQRVVDPACGSGTFLFHAIRLLLDASDREGLDNEEALRRCCRLVLGVDIHPVAVQIARVTYLLALGEERLRNHPPLAIPVYLGDSLQWNTRGFMAEREILIEVPESGPLLEFPFAVAGDPSLFDSVIDEMLRLSTEDAPNEALSAWLHREQELDEATVETLIATYEHLRTLHRERRDHIWGFVARNLVRPVWLSQQEQRADVLVGNPPWLSYRYMSTSIQERFRQESQNRGIWMGQVAQQQDLSAYFFARCVELYLKPEGLIAFVLPYAAMTRRQFAGFRTGIFGARRRGTSQQLFAVVRVVNAWAFAENVFPLFPVPSCVLFAEYEANSALAPAASRLPATVLYASGELSQRDATLQEAEELITWREGSWPAARTGESTGSYSNRFRAGAVIFPSVLFRVLRVETGRLGGNPNAPLVESRRTNLEKPPWKDLPSLRGNVEADFLRPLYLGESVAPFRLLRSALAVIPSSESNDGGLMDAELAQRRGHLLLARWLADANRLWQEYGRNRRSVIDQMDYFGQLSAQLPSPPVRVVYAASGTLPAAAILHEQPAICEHKLYWAAITDELEGYYLIGIFNSETARRLSQHLQSRGQWGARDFDKVMLDLPIPHFDSNSRLHIQIVEAAKRAEQVAAAVPLPEREYFVRTRQRIRAALREDGVAQEIDSLVEELLGAVPTVTPPS